MHRAPFGRPVLSASDVGWRRLALGAFAGVAFALTFHLAFLGVTQVAVPIFETYSPTYVERWREPPDLVPGPAEAEEPWWVEPFWAGLSAALGQAVAVAVWFAGGLAAPAIRDRRRQRRRRYAVSQSLVWVGLAPLVFVKLGELYVAIPYHGAIWMSSLRRPPFEDPFAFLGPTAALAVLFLALEPWRGLALAYRCRWWPMLGVVCVVAGGAALFAIGRLAFAGAA